MSEWPLVTLGDHVDFLTGFPFTSKDYTDDPNDTRLISGYNIMQGYLRWDNINRWPTSKSTGLKDYKLRIDDVVLAMDRPWIDAGLKYSWMREEDLPCLLVQRTARLRGTKTLDVRFLRYLIGSSEFTSHVQAITTGTAVPHISPTGIKSFKFRLPPLPTQRRIAEILGRLDDKIEVNRRINRTLEAMAQALFQHHFVEFGPYQAELVESEAGLIPRGWEVGNLGEVVRICDNLRIPLSNMERAKRQGPYPYYGATSVMDYVDDYIFDGIYTLIGEDGSVIRPDNTPFVQYVFGQFWVNNHAHVLQGKGYISTEHVKVALDQANVRPFVTGAVQAKISQENLKKIPFIIAPDEINKAFDEKLQIWFAQIRQNELENRKLAEIRDYLLPRLLSGQVEAF